ncbi:MAG: disulfide reductase [Methanosarcinales archaeon]|nr:disulfide reductase [Methanosarcinales archaeon]
MSEYYSQLELSIMMAAITVSLLLFVIGMLINFKKWGIGSADIGGEPADGGRIGNFCKSLFGSISEKSAHQSVIKTLILDVILQRRTLRRAPARWVMHMLIFVGWMGLALISFIMFAIEVVAAEQFVAYRDAFMIPNDILGYMVLVGITWALIRRIVVKNVLENSILYDWTLIIGLFIITVSGFMAQGVGGILTTIPGVDFVHSSGLSLFHVIISLLFCIAYIPYSKYIHIIATPLVILANGGGE